MSHEPDGDADGDADDAPRGEINSCRVSDVFRRLADVMDNPVTWRPDDSSSLPDEVRDDRLYRLVDDAKMFALEAFGRNITQDVGELVDPEDES